MEQQPKNLGDLISDIAYRKQRAAQARFGRQTTDGPAPKDVYIQSCADIADAFAADGFRFTRTGPHFSRRAGDFIYRIAFASSSNNIRGEYVALSVYVNVRSPVLKKWRIAHRSVRGPYDFVAGGHIGRLTTGGWLEWNLADLTKRHEKIASVVQEIRETAILYFAQFDDPSVVSSKLGRGELVGMDLMNSFDFLACFSTLAAARDFCEGLFVAAS